MLITILGPDGTGKTTLATALSEKIDRLEYFYFGGSNESRRYRFFESFIKSDLKNFLLRIIRKVLRILNDYDVFYISTQKNIISDRCPIDNYIITKIQNRKIRYYYYIVLLLSPNPDFVILLNGDAETIFKRKEELSVSDIRKYINFYKNYLDKKGINYCMIDTVKNDINKTLCIAKEELEKRL